MTHLSSESWTACLWTDPSVIELLLSPSSILAFGFLPPSLDVPVEILLPISLGWSRRVFVPNLVGNNPSPLPIPRCQRLFAPKLVCKTAVSLLELYLFDFLGWLFEVVGLSRWLEEIVQLEMALRFPVAVLAGCVTLDKKTTKVRIIIWVASLSGVGVGDDTLALWKLCLLPTSWMSSPEILGQKAYLFGSCTQWLVSLALG